MDTSQPWCLSFGLPVRTSNMGTLRQYQKMKCAVPACRTIDVPANMTVSEQQFRMDIFAWSNNKH